MFKMEKITFDEIANVIINKDKYQSLKKDSHHGLTRYEHLLRVGKYTYKITKFLKLNYISATKGALLHDYFNEVEYLNIREMEKLRIHPFLALNNAKFEYNLTLLEENIIASHMFPIGRVKPKYVESWIVSLVDKVVAIYEFLNNKVKDKFALWIIFIINIISFKADL